jgi:tetratricopeptide (TPR) repeat protein
VTAIAGDRVEIWQGLAEIYQRQNLVTRAEAAAATAEALAPGSTVELSAWARRTRSRYGLPTNAGRWHIGLDDEGDYVTAVREILDEVYRDHFPAARTRVASADKRWRGAPGLLAARCDLALRTKATGAARKLCDQAIAAWSGAAWALYLRGVLLVQSGKTQAAITSLRAAIAAEPELAQAYRTLAKAYDRAQDGAGRAGLAVEYQAHFGSQLP